MHVIAEVAKAIGGSFKLHVVTLAPRTVREMTQLPRETQKNGDTQTNQKAQVNSYWVKLVPTGTNEQEIGSDELQKCEVIFCKAVR